MILTLLLAHLQTANSDAQVKTYRIATIPTYQDKHITNNN